MCYDIIIADTGKKYIGMPNVTDTRYRADYQLYTGKPCIGEASDLCRGCMARRIESIGEEPLWNTRGDSPHWRKR